MNEPNLLQLAKQGNAEAIASLLSGGLDFGSYLLINTIRFIPLPLIHAVFAGIVGYFLGLAAINRSRQGAIIFIGLVNVFI